MKRHKSPRFEDLLRPASPQKFFADYWQKAPVINRKTSEYDADAILSLNDMDTLIATLGEPDINWIMLVKEGQTLPIKFLKTADALINLGAVYDYFNKGYTIVLTKADKRHKPLGLFCRDMEASLLDEGCLLTKNIGANIYLTPPNSKGFPVHYDNHDVFIIQSAGSKVWRIFDQLEVAPVKRFEAAVAEDILPRKIFGEKIIKNNSIYIPRGFYHDAVSTDELSLHITISINQMKWMDLLQYVMEKSPAFRADIPLEFFAGKGNAGKSAMALTAKFADLLEPAACQKAYEELAEKLFGNTPVFPDNGFSRKQEDLIINGDSRVEKSLGTYSKVIVNKEEVLLLYPRSGIKLPVSVLPAITFIHKSKKFKVRDIPDVFTMDTKITLIRELIGDGFLNIISANEKKETGR